LYLQTFLHSLTFTDIPANYLNKHNFKNDMVDYSVPVPELYNLSHNGFSISNYDGDYYIDIVIESCLYGAKHLETANSLLSEQNSYDIVADTDWVYASHYWNIADYSNIAVSQQNIDIKSLWGVDNLSSLIDDFKAWSEEYPTHRDLPDYNFFKHYNASYSAAYMLRHIYRDNASEDGVLLSSGRAQTSYYVRFYDKDMNCGQWVCYTYRDGEYVNNSKLYPEISVSNVSSDASGNPVTSSTQSGYQTEDGTGDYSVSYPSTDDISTLDTTPIWEVITNLVASLGQLPSLIGSVFVVMPSWLINMIWAGLGAIVVLRFLGR
jgi:hypothetical protein